MDTMKLFEMAVELLMVPILVYVLTLLRGYIMRTVKIKQVESILLQAANAVELAVGETTQVFVDVLKEKGEFTEHSAREAFTRAKARTLDILGPAGQALLERSVGDLNDYMQALIEAEVLRQKEGR